MHNPYYTQSAAIREKVKEQLPNGLETTADLLLEFMSKSKDEQLRDTAAFIKASKKSEEIGMVLTSPFLCYNTMLFLFVILFTIKESMESKN